jgi:phage head maturation protease
MLLYQDQILQLSADKMNVVYRGVVNPMSISFAGISDKDVNASALV